MKYRDYVPQVIGGTELSLIDKIRQLVGQYDLIDSNAVNYFESLIESLGIFPELFGQLVTFIVKNSENEVLSLFEARTMEYISFHNRILSTLTEKLQLKNQGSINAANYLNERVSPAIAEILNDNRRRYPDSKSLSDYTTELLSLLAYLNSLDSQPIKDELSKSRNAQKQTKNKLKDAEKFVQVLGDNQGKDIKTAFSDLSSEFKKEEESAYSKFLHAVYFESGLVMYSFLAFLLSTIFPRIDITIRSDMRIMYYSLQLIALSMVIFFAYKYGLFRKLRIENQNKAALVSGFLLLKSEELLGKEASFYEDFSKTIFRPAFPEKEKIESGLPTTQLFNLVEGKIK